jgi:hypothetical protein
MSEEMPAASFYVLNARRFVDPEIQNSPGKPFRLRASIFGKIEFIQWPI